MLTGEGSYVVGGLEGHCLRFARVGGEGQIADIVFRKADVGLFIEHKIVALDACSDKTISDTFVEHPELEVDTTTETDYSLVVGGRVFGLTIEWGSDVFFHQLNGGFALDGGFRYID